MVPHRTLPIVGNTTRTTPGRQVTAGSRPRSILHRLTRSLGARQHVSDASDQADVIRLDRDLALIEHETCDCV